MRFLAIFPLLFPAVYGQATGRVAVKSHVTISSLDGRSQQVVFTSDKLFEAPNWTPDGKWLVLNSEGRLWRVPVGGGEPTQISAGNLTRINNDHGITLDGRWVAVSAGQIYVLPLTGGEPRQVTSRAPSYFHGWSPDGRMLAYCAPREGNYDIYAIPFEGGEERRLTTDPAFDDGPDYTPDGKWIYFNSDRSGSMDIWRIPAAGVGAEDRYAQRVTSDEYEDWFPHPSPDGKWIVFLSYAKGTRGHPANHNVALRKMPVSGGRPTELIKLFGGQGTINVNSWSPDSRRFAYVRYEHMRGD